MTHPDREELAGRLEELCRCVRLRVAYDPDEARAALTEAAAALRQSPSVEEVARVIAPDAFDRAVPIGPRRVIHRNAMKAAHAIDRLYRGSKE